MVLARFQLDIIKIDATITTHLLLYINMTCGFKERIPIRPYDYRDIGIWLMHHPDIRDEVSDADYDRARNQFRALLDRGRLPDEIYYLKMNYNCWLSGCSPEKTRSWGRVYLAMQASSEILSSTRYSSLNERDLTILKAADLINESIRGRMVDMHASWDSVFGLAEEVINHIADHRQFADMLPRARLDYYLDRIRGVEEQFRLDKILVKQGRINVSEPHEDVMILIFKMLGFLKW